jgi:hypothetical protein
LNTAHSLKQISSIIENEINALEADLKDEISSFKTEYRESELSEYQRLKALMADGRPIDFKKKAMISGIRWGGHPSDCLFKPSRGVKIAP